MVLTRMEPCADFVKVPVIDVHRENFERYRELITESINNASFVALDCVSSLRLVSSGRRKLCRVSQFVKSMLA
jgi:hypothetical protein